MLLRLFLYFTTFFCMVTLRAIIYILIKYTTLAGSLHLNVSLSSSSSYSSLFWLDKVRSALIVVLLWLIFLYLLVKVGSNWEKKVRLNEKQANADLDELTVRSVSFFLLKKCVLFLFHSINALHLYIWQNIPYLYSINHMRILMGEQHKLFYA